MPFLLLAGWEPLRIGTLVIILETARRRSRWWLVVDIAAALLGVGALDWFVDAFSREVAAELAVNRPSMRHHSFT